MNLPQLKQYLGNNLWYGENGRNRFIVGDDDGNYITVQSVVMPDGSKVWIIDISHWNAPPVDLKRMVDLFGLSGVIIKGCDGSLNTRYYVEHVAAAKLAGIPWGMYVWLYRAANVSIEAQTTTWANRAKLDPPPMGVWIDAEWTSYGGNPSNPTATDLRSAHNSFKLKYGKPAGTYTAPGYANQYLVGFDFTKEENWIAEWGYSPPVIWKNPWILHQFTDKLDGKVLDPNGNLGIDGSYFNGNNAQFAAKYGGVVTPPPTGETMDTWFECIVGSLNIRSSGKFDGLNNDLGVFQLVKGDKVHAVQRSALSSNYLQFDKLFHNGVLYQFTMAGHPDRVESPTGEYWTAETGTSGTYLQETTDPNPPPVGEPAVMEIMLADGSSVIVRDLAGSELFRWP